MLFKSSNSSHPNRLNLISFPGNVETLILLLKKLVRKYVILGFDAAILGP